MQREKRVPSRGLYLRLARDLWGRLPPEFYFEAALKIWPVAQTVFKFCHNFTSVADIIGELGTLRKRHNLLQFGDSMTGMTLWWLRGHKMDRTGDWLRGVC